MTNVYVEPIIIKYRGFRSIDPIHLGRTGIRMLNVHTLDSLIPVPSGWIRSTDLKTTVALECIKILECPSLSA